mgnify:FL=1
MIAVAGSRYWNIAIATALMAASVFVIGSANE